MASNRRANPERRACIQLHKDFCQQYPKYVELFYHVDNGGRMSVPAGRLRKALGVKSGVSDYFLAKVLRDSSPQRGLLYAGLYLEMKSLTGTVSEDQKRFMRAVRHEGYCAVVAYGYDEGMAALDAYMRADMGVLYTLQLADTRKDRRAAGRPVGRKYGDEGCD